MPDPNIIVSTVKDIDHPTERGGMTTIHFDNGQIGLLNTFDHRAEPYEDILKELQTLGDPVYLETDSALLITRLLIPVVVTVTNISALASGDVQVEVEPSQARHLVLFKDRNAEQLLRVLQEAREKHISVILTETPEEHTIIDVRPVVNPRMPAAEFKSPAEIKRVKFEPKAMSSKRALELFEFVSNRSCEPMTVPYPCIPFLYPDDGCWARAHEMCRLIQEQGGNVQKLWIYGDLLAHTPNNPKCSISWIWHVAPIILVDDEATQEIQVMDPALFHAPVGDALWRHMQHDPKANLVVTDASVFLRSRTGWHQDDLDYEKTRKTLAQYRLKLKLRCTSAYGPPPYKCPRETVRSLL
jgi:hypothetical protein